MPPENGHLRRLQVLRLNINSLSGFVPVNIPNCLNLVLVSFGCNRLEGKIPKENPLNFEVQDNKLTGKLPNLQKLVNLETFNIYRNQLGTEYGMGSEVTTNGDVYSFGILLLKLFTGKRPTNGMFVSTFTTVKMGIDSSVQMIPGGNETDRLALLAIKAQLKEDPNQFLSSSNESSHFCLWRGVTCSKRHRERVTGLDLSGQKLAGTISPHIGNLSFLMELYFQNNSLSGQIPPEIGRLRRLQVLRLSINSLSGFIPVNISNCLNLWGLDFGYNQLIGKIPREFGSFPKLKRLVLEFNTLVGEIPDSLGNLFS
ncbi:receptor kinase-like protein Xa21 [Pyrus x bretschneideri]|uniref:receptor kinase-like protein Xa21 n=1 Tax=Pyrus x bretschneideri TaxID=225117 RepID=UPI00202F21B6|nr:receptor kinase-like protein Xa21 [Pyrus x bretschneideri]